MSDRTFFHSRCCTLPVAVPPIAFLLAAIRIFPFLWYSTGAYLRLPKNSASRRLVACDAAHSLLTMGIFASLWGEAQMGPATCALLACLFVSTFVFFWSAFDGAAMLIMRLMKGQLTKSSRTENARRRVAVAFIVPTLVLVAGALVAASLADGPDDVYNRAVVALLFLFYVPIALIGAAFIYAAREIAKDASSMQDSDAADRTKEYAKSVSENMNRLGQRVIMFVFICTPGTAGLATAYLATGTFAVSWIILYPTMLVLPIVLSWSRRSLVKRHAAASETTRVSKRNDPVAGATVVATASVRDNRSTEFVVKSPTTTMSTTASTPGLGAS